MKKILMSVAVVFAVVSLALIGTGQPALASYSECPAGKLCTYWTTIGGDPMYYYSEMPSGTCTAIGASWNDQISSGRNRTGKTVTFNQDAGCHNDSIKQSNYYPGDEGNISYWMNNTTSSLYWN